MIEAVLFDIDGTLVDSVHSHSRAYAEALRERGKEVDESEVARYVGLAGPDLLPHFLSPEEIESFGDEVLARKKALWFERYQNEAIPIPGAREMIQRLGEMGFRLAIGSSAGEEELSTLKRLGGISDLLPIAVDADDVEHTKPAPDVWFAAAAKVKTLVDACVAIGDTPYDLQAARAAGARAIGVTTGVFGREELLEAGAEETYADPRDLLDRLHASRLLATGPATDRQLP